MNRDASLLALLSKPTRASRSSILVATSATASARWPSDHGTEVPDRDLPRVIKSKTAPDKAPQVVVTGRLSPTLLRALRTRPPALLVVVGQSDCDQDISVPGALPGTLVLGPDACVRLGDGDTVVCAADAEALGGLCRCLGGERLALGVAPTPSWLHRWLADDALASRPLAGTIDARVLSIAWAHWARQRHAPFVLVPLGLPQPPLDEPGHPALSWAVAAHALERHTGPVFPAPRVIVGVLAGLRQDVAVPLGDAVAPVTDAQAAIWAQARRALPMTGAVLGMDRPRVPASDSTTAAFLAQRALLRVHRAHTLAQRVPPPIEPADPDGIARADVLLNNTGQVLTDHESKVVLRGFSIEVTRQAVATSASGATGFADRIGYPVVLKALSPDLRRRADIGAIELELPTGAAVRRAYASIVDNVEQRAPTARLDGVLVAEMVPPGLDVHCGVVRLPGDEGLAIYGRTLEAMTTIEPAMALLPLDATAATLLAHAILTRLPVPGLRRADDPDVDDLAGLLRALAAVAEHAGDRIESIDLSPVRLVGSPRRCVVLDASIRQRPHLEGR